VGEKKGENHCQGRRAVCIHLLIGEPEEQNLKTILNFLKKKGKEQKDQRELNSRGMKRICLFKHIQT